FQAAGVALFPASDNDLVTDCSCPDWSNPCKHVAAVHYLLGERFDTDPFLIFLLRGKSGEDVAVALRLHRAGGAIDAAVEVEAVPDDRVEESESLLTGTTAQFWGTSAGAPVPAVTFVPPAVDAVAVKRLGAPAFAPDADQFIREFEQKYRTIGEYARRLALGED
ncbi:MAG: SWIM zinc finger family protein, partial [Dehalococcoidia bacterium]